MKTATSSAISIPLVMGDLLCFLLFAVLGLRSHEDGITLSSLVRVAVPFQVAWLVVSLGLKGRLGTSDVSEPKTVLSMWLPAWLLGLALRTLLFDRSLALAFAIISFLVNALLLLAWRSFLAPKVVRQG